MVDVGSPNSKTEHASDNQLEILMFTLESKDDSGQQTLYGINVFKVRELITLPRLIQKPNSHECAPGMANVRGIAVPVIDLQKYYGFDQPSEQNILILTEFSGSTQGFIVNEVNTIIQLDWQKINQPPPLVSQLTGVNRGNTLTGISLLPDDAMLMIVDLEKIITEVLGSGVDVVAEARLAKKAEDFMVFFADDSLVARKQISGILDKMGIRYQCAKDGQEALDMLDKMAQEAELAGEPLSKSLSAVITDIEMPKMDGYMLTTNIKADSRFNGIPVMMHSSISAEESKRLGQEAGVDAYITKLQPKEFSEALDKLFYPSVDEAA